MVIRVGTEISGKGIDYQNLGVRHLGSIYEALCMMEMVGHVLLQTMKQIYGQISFIIIMK